MGGVAFALVRDGSGTTQITLKKGETPEALFQLFAEIPRESVVEVEGTVRISAKAKRGIELAPSAASVVSRAEVPLPLGIVDKVGAELDTRLNHRVLDLRKPKVRAVFELRGALLGGFREAFVRHGFLEVETPKLLRQGAEGGATLFPVEYFEERAYLAQSPQLYKQMLMAAGFERVFEIAPAWRAEPSDTVRHTTEFTSLDAEMAYVESAEEIRVLLETVVLEALQRVREVRTRRDDELLGELPTAKGPFPRIPFTQCEEWLGRPDGRKDFGAEDEKAIAERVRAKHGVPFYFITDFPSAVKAQTFYAQRLPDDLEKTGYFDLYFREIELASGGPREHRLDRLLANMAAAGLDSQAFPSYLEAFRFGMPAHGGWGLGVDRLVMVLAGLSNIREARLFPRDRYRLEP